MLLSLVAALVAFIMPESASSLEDAALSGGVVLQAHDTSENEESAGAVVLSDAFSFPKEGNSDDENEDGFCLNPCDGYFAIADGASSSFRSGEWAKFLCQDFVEQKPLNSRRALRDWFASAPNRFDSSDTPSDQFWVADAISRDSHATFLGLAVFQHADGFAFRAAAVGDSVLVQLRETGGVIDTVGSFPLHSQTEFSDSPPLVSRNDRVKDARFIDADLRVGDWLLAATDELSHWAMVCASNEQPIWRLLCTGTRNQVEDAISRARSSKSIANDDMTLMRIQLEG